VTEPVGSDAELDRHEGFAREAERHVGQRLAHRLGADRAGEEFVDHDPLVVPPHDPLRLFEARNAVRAASGLRRVDLVVELQHQQVKLRDDDVLVVARIADQRAPLGVPGQIVAVRPQQELEGLVTVIKIGLLRGAEAVEAVELQDRRAEVARRARIDLLLQDRGRIEGEVMVDELTEEGVARPDAVVVLRGIKRIPAIHRPARLAKLERAGIEFPQ
jgi:hypothetical protein